MKRGFAVDPQKMTVRAGETATVDFSLREAPPQAQQLGSFMGAQRRDENTQLVPYHELYPPDPARELVEDTCVYCHGMGFLPGRKWTTASANAASNLSLMLLRELGVGTLRGREDLWNRLSSCRWTSG